MRVLAPSTPDWGWFGSQSLEELARIGTDPTEPNRWVVRAYAWLYDRLEPERRAGLKIPIADGAEGPPRDHFPVLIGTRAEAGAIGFVVIRFSDTAISGGAGRTYAPMQEAASSVADWFRCLSHNTLWPSVELRAGVPCGGPSGSLSALMLALGHVTHSIWPDDLCATGCWQDGTLVPVSASTIGSKIEAALTWGYRRLVVVEGQDGLPAKAGLEIVEIPRDPLMACLSLTRVLADQGAEEAVAQMLAVFDRGAVRGGLAGPQVRKVLEATERFVAAGSPPLVCHIAHDIRSRALMHAGETADAAKEDGLAKSCRPEFLPDGWIGDYLRWHQPASRAILAIDRGRWDDDAPDHVAVDRAIDHLEEGFRAGGLGFREMYGALALRNTRGRRYEFLGRWNRDLGLLRSSWLDRTRFADSWDELFAYCRRLGLSDTTLHRQHNQCMDVLASYWEWEGHLPPADWGWQEFTFYPDEEAPAFEEWGAYDVACWVRWKRITEQGVREEDVQRALERGIYLAAGGRNTYPVTLIFEAILRYQFGTAAQRHAAAATLAESQLVSRRLSGSSILTLLAIRTMVILKETEGRYELALHAERRTPVAVRAQDLMDMRCEVLARCPY